MSTAVLPVDDRTAERLNPDIAGRPQLVRGTTRDRFTGRVNWVKLDLGSDAHYHLVDPEHALAVAMSLQ